MRNSIRAALTLCLLVIAAAPAYADCTSPAGPAGRIDYTSSFSEQVFKYCNGTDWVPWAGEPVTGAPAPSAGFDLGDLGDVDTTGVGDGECITYNNGAGEWQSGSCGSGGTPAGNTGEIQFNSGGAFGADANLVYDVVSGRLGIGGTPSSHALEVVADDHQVLKLKTTNGASQVHLIVEQVNTGAPFLIRTQNAGNEIWLQPGGPTRLNISATGVGVNSGTNPVSWLGVNGNASIGSGYYSTAAPTDGLIVEGNVGIGTASPDYTLDIVGDGTQGKVALKTYHNSLGLDSGLLFFRARNTEAAPAVVPDGDDVGNIAFAAYDGNTFEENIKIEAVVNKGSATSDEDIPMDLVFYLSPNSEENVVERMRIASNGNVGIGDTTPDVALDVVGDINYTGVIVDVSDIRMKYDIEPLQSPLAKLTSLNGFSFKMKGDEKEQVEYGVAAQDVQKAFPELVHQVDENGTLGVSYNGLIAPMIEAIKELKAENETLKARLEALEQQQIREQ